MQKTENMTGDALTASRGREGALVESGLAGNLEIEFEVTIGLLCRISGLEEV
jgi:hypothetical protein